MVAENCDENIMESFLRNGGIQLNSINEVMFENPAKLNFNLKFGSPAIDNGVFIDGFHDSLSVNPDIGPFEFGIEVPIDWPRPRETMFISSPPEFHGVSTFSN